MKKPDHVQTKEKPKSILSLGNEAYYYNYDIKPCKIFSLESKSEVDGWDFIPVYIKGIPNYKECVKKVIRTFIDQDEEFDLINTFNRSGSAMTLKSGEDSEYKQYLDLLDEIKNKTKVVFK